MHKPQKFLQSDKLHAKQLQIFFTMTTLYTFYFASNYNLGPATKFIQDDFGISSSNFGILFTIFTICFAAGQFIFGFLGDRYSAKRMMLIGALGAVVSNYLFGMSSSLFLFAIFWGMNAFFLSMGWSPGCSILNQWFPEKRQGLFMGIYNAFSFLGGVIVYPLAAFSISIWGWRSAFFIPPFLLFLWALLFLKVVKDSPRDAGFDVEWSKEKSCEDDIKVGLKDYWKVLTHPMMNVVYAAAICSQFVRWGLVNWVVKIMTEPVSAGGYGMSLVLSASLAALMHWGGIFFSISLGYLSDRIFKGKRWQSVAIGFFLSAITLICLFILGTDIIQKIPGGIWLLGAFLFISGGCIQGLQAPIFNLPSAILGNRLGGTGAGIVNGWSYIGASLSGISLGAILDKHGFMSIFLLMAAVSLLGGIIIIFVRK